MAAKAKVVVRFDECKQEFVNDDDLFSCAEIGAWRLIGRKRQHKTSNFRFFKGVFTRLTSPYNLK